MKVANGCFLSHRNQSYDFASEYVNNEDNSHVPMQQSGIVGLSSSMNISASYESQQGKILVPSDMSNISQMQPSSLSGFQSSILAPDIGLSSTMTKMESDGKRRRPKVYQCAYQGCGKCFDSQWALTRHSRVHTGEKPFKCEYPGCERCFSEKGGLKRHMISHEQLKPYKCPHPGCDKCFKSRDYLESHRRIHEEDDPYKCVINNCNRTFSSMKSLRKHQVTWHNSKGTESPTEQLLREKILKLQQKHKERIDKMEIHLKDILEHNRQLKKENAQYRRDNSLPLNPNTKSRKRLFELYFFKFDITTRDDIDQQEDDQMKLQVSIHQSLLNDKGDLSNSIFSHSINCPPEIGPILGASHVSDENMIVLPSISSIQHNDGHLQLDQDMGDPNSSSILL